MQEIKDTHSFVRCINSSCSNSLVKEIIRVVLPLTTHNDATVNRVALDSLSTLALLFDEFRKLDDV